MTSSITNWIFMPTLFFISRNIIKLWKVETHENIHQKKLLQRNPTQILLPAVELCLLVTAQLTSTLFWKRLYKLTKKKGCRKSLSWVSGWLLSINSVGSIKGNQPEHSTSASNNRMWPHAYWAEKNFYYRFGESYIGKGIYWKQRCSKHFKGVYLTVSPKQLLSKSNPILVWWFHHHWPGSKERRW
jgi:hypothetical protein